MEKYFTGDVGTRREYEIAQESGTPIAVDTLDVLFVRFRKPDRSTFDRDLTPDEDEAAVAFYDFVEGELDQAGYWKAAYRAEYEDGRGWWSEWEWFHVDQHILANVEAS